ncbi:MAG: DUF4743 domain-containing protein [Gammaproteobacteria bacterium]|nr:DUF4743 domain-containing protein [Gammaproteobacteria bacterium]
MSINNQRYLDWIIDCNQYNLADFLPFIVEEKIIGYVHHDNLAILHNYNEYLNIDDQKLVFVEAINTSTKRSEAMRAIVDDMYQQGTLKTLVGEDYDVMLRFGDPILFKMERAATSFFGIHKYGIHVNGYVIKDEKYFVWVATRAKDKPMWPGKYDHIVAGGHGTGMSVEETMKKECQEEANISPQLLANAKAVGTVSYIVEKKKKLSRDALFIYDILLPETFTPVNTDGEVDSFELLAIEDVLNLVNNTDKYKLNCNLVVIDFAIRHGFIKPDEPLYLQLTEGLNVDTNPLI